MKQLLKISEVAQGTSVQFNGLSCIVLQQSQQGALVISAEILSRVAFDTNNCNDWIKSTLRRYLNNGDFYKEFLTSIAYQCIVETEWDTSYSDDVYKPNAKVTDRVGLLSKEQYQEFKPFLKDTQTWWLITPCYARIEGCTVRPTCWLSQANSYYLEQANKENGLRPCFILNSDTMVSVKVPNQISQSRGYMTRTFISVNDGVQAPNVLDVIGTTRKNIMYQLEQAVDRALDLSDLKKKAAALAKLGIFYDENLFEFPDTKLLVTYKSGDISIQCALKTWYSANVSIPKFYESEFLKIHTDFVNVPYDSARMMYGCRAFIRDITELIEGRVDAVDYGVLVVRLSESKLPENAICACKTCVDRRYCDGF